MLTELAVRDVMVEDVLTVEPDDPASDAAATMRDHDVGSVVVVDDGEPVGVVTAGDLVALLAGADAVADADALEDRRVDEVASSPPVTIAPSASLADAAARFASEGVKRLPVVADGSLAGIVAVSDLSYYQPTVALGRRPGGYRPSDRAEVAFEAEEWVTELEGDGTSTDVGDVVRFSKTLDEADVRAFARASGDTNRLHLDDEFAEGTRFGGRIVHGTLVAGLLSAALARLPGLTIYLSQDLTFEGPVPIGARVTGTCEVVEQLGEQRYRCDTTVLHDGEAVIDGEATVLIDPIEDAEPLEEAEV